MKKACKNCKYWVETHEPNKMGLCQRYPEWTTSPGGHFCWEFKSPPKEKKKAEVPYHKRPSTMCLNLYQDIFGEVFGHKPYIDQADRAAAGRLAERYDRATIEKCFRSFLTEPPNWNRDNNRYELRLIPKVMNLLLARISVDETP